MKKLENTGANYNLFPEDENKINHEQIQQESIDLY